MPPTPSTAATGRSSGTRLLVLLSAAIAALLAILLPASTAPASTSPAAGTRVGAIGPATTHLVGVHECIRAGQRPVRGPSQPQTVVGNCVAADSGVPNAVIGKVKDLGSVGDNEYTLLDKLPDQGSPAANWSQNSGVLRQEMSRGVPIRDASVDPATGEQLDNTGFLRAERNLLQTKGWTYDPKTTLWSPGG